MWNVAHVLFLLTQLAGGVISALKVHGLYIPENAQIALLTVGSSGYNITLIWRLLWRAGGRNPWTGCKRITGFSQERRIKRVIIPVLLLVSRFVATGAAAVPWAYIHGVEVHLVVSTPLHRVAYTYTYQLR